MKKLILSLALLLSTLGIVAQSSMKLTEGQPVFVYSLPKMVFSIDVEVEKTTQKPGQFYQHSERYLATNQVIKEEKTFFKLKSITLKPIAVPDPKRTYQIEAKGGKSDNFITVDTRGILCGVNVPSPVEKPVKPIIAIESENSESNSLLPLSEEYLMAGSSAKLAEGAAKQIYRIRESRMTLLSGDMDNLPSDGKAFDSMLKGLEKSEQELTELFVGKKTIERIKYNIHFTPDSAYSNRVLFRLSALRGLVDATDLGGSPYYISFDVEKTAARFSSIKSKTESTTLNTILPANTKVTITDGVKALYTADFYIPQFGVVIPVSEQILATPKIKIKVDNLTGRMLEIER